MSSSGIAYPASVPCKLIGAWRHGALEMVLSPFILDGLRRVLPRPVNRHSLSATEMDDLVDILSIQAEVIEPAPVTPLSWPISTTSPCLAR